MRNFLFSAAVVPLVAAGPVWASEVLVENRSNNDIYVARAYQKWKGDLATEGWTKIAPNGSHTFTAPDADRMYLRIEKKNKEVTFVKHQSFAFWPVREDRFTVSKPYDEASVRILKWGDKLEHSHNIRKDGALPKGWENRRFFHVGDGKLHLHIDPD